MGGAGKVVAVYDRETEELLEEFAGSSDVKSVAIWESAQGESGRGWIVAGFEDGTLKVWDAGVSAPTPSNPSPRPDCPCACGSFPGAQGGEEERAQRLGEVRGLLTRWQDHCLRIRRPGHQSLGCRYPSLPDPSPSPNLSAPTLAAASLELKAEKQSAHSDFVRSVAFSPDGKTIVSGSRDETIKVWDAGVSTDTLEPLDQN